jgi:Brp/Blh family beta-carotene 15,15'-monooxygenase
VAAIMDLILLVAPLVLMALLGVPHGALDGYVIQSVSRNNRDSIALFACYVLLAAMSIGSWLLYPTAAMLSFLAISVMHFGRSDIARQQYAQPMLAILARGGLWVIALPIIQWHTTESMFAHLQTDTDMVHGALSIAMVPWAVGSIAHLLAEFRRGHRRVCSEWLIGLLIVLLLPALWAICVYFCGWHARRHMARVLSCSKDAKLASRYMLAFTALTLSIAAALYLLFFQQVEIESAVLTVFFVGLFAVTVPHMILIDYYLPRWQAHWRLK